MKGFFSWFNSKTKIKRWIFLILVGVVLTCFSIANILEAKILKPVDIIKIVGSFVAGFSLIVVSIIFMQRRILEILVEANNSNTKKGQDAKLNMKSLIFNRTMFDEGPKVVVIGGGTGLNTVIRGFKKYTNNITAIVTISDYGNINAESRKALETLPFGDIKESIASLSDKEDLMRKLMNWNFRNKRLKGIEFGDVYLLALNEMFNGVSEGIQKSTEILDINGRVLPSTLDEITICAELKDGTMVENKDKIPEVVFDKVTQIERIYINPSNCRVGPGVIEAIQDADAIVIGPGSLYTNVLPNLLVKGVSKAIKESKALKIYVSNIMTEPGQTDNYSISDHLDAIFKHTDKDIVDYCLADTGEIVPEYVRMYNKKGSDIVEQDISKANKKGIKIIQKHLSMIDGEYIRHNPDEIALTIMELIGNDLKFRDKKATPEYMLLNSILIDEKKRSKKNQKSYNKQVKVNERNIKKNGKGRKKSKFNAKYRDRIESIQTSDEKKRQNMRMQMEMEKAKNKK